MSTEHSHSHGENFEALAKSFEAKNLPNSEIEITGEIPADAIAHYREHALGDIAAKIDMPGFRKGHVPQDIALKQVGEMAVLEEAVELFMRDFYPELITVREIDVVGRPEIQILKLAPGNPVEVRINSAVYPVVKLPKNWKEVAAQVPKEDMKEVSDKDVDEALISIRRAHAKANSEVPVAPDAEIKEEDLPKADDAFAKTLGNFTGMEDLTMKLRSNMRAEREQQARDNRRGKIIDALLEKTEVDIPRIFVESELEKIIAQLKDDVARFGLTFEGYLEQIKKTEADLRKEFEEQARKRAKLQLILNKLAADEKVEADQEAVETEMKHALEHFPEAKTDLLRIHIETVLRNEKTLQILEGAEEK